jgi:hypothetical protein
MMDLDHECLLPHHEDGTIRNGRHWQMARFELPVKEVERKQGNRTVVDIVVGLDESLAYVHKYTGKRVEFTRPRLDNMEPYLEEATAKWECELAIAEANKREKSSCVIGFLDLSAVRTNDVIVKEWNQKAANDPSWVKWPTKLSGVPGAFGGR